LPPRKDCCFHEQKTALEWDSSL